MIDIHELVWLLFYGVVRGLVSSSPRALSFVFLLYVYLLYVYFLSGFTPPLTSVEFENIISTRTPPSRQISSKDL